MENNLRVWYFAGWEYHLAKIRLLMSEFLYFTYIKMKNYTLDELLQTKKAQKLMDENLSSCNDEEDVYAVLELKYWRYENWKSIYDFDDLENAIDDVENQKYTIYHCMDCYFDSMDDLLEFPRGDSIFERYFDYDAYHRDCEYDVEEASNWRVIADW